jgi:hypothetical protein
MTGSKQMEALARLERIVERVEADLSGYESPELVRGSNGSYVLLDAYAALVMGYAAIGPER